MTERTRRSVLKTAGASLAATTLVAGTSTAASNGEWTSVESPVDGALHDVQYTAGGAHAVGVGGVLLERTSKGWKKLLDGGPSGNGNDLYGAAVTDDGERLWIVGASGAIGEYDVTTGNLENRSAPMDVTNNFNDVAIVGPAGDAEVYVAGDSGKIYYSFENGEEGTWDDVTPGSGSALPAIEAFGARSVHAIDTNGRVFETTDGVTWEPIGLEDADVTFYGLDSDGRDDVTVSGGNATVFEYDGKQWTPESLGDADLVDIETESGDGYAVGGGGVVFGQSGGEWSLMDTPTGENLNAIVSGDVDIAVGAGGTVLER
jgi:photosystem II stability/assembly factor-like uncharacterized protein